MAEVEEKKGDDVQRMDDGTICELEMDKQVKTTSALIVAKKQIVKEATDKLDVQQLWLKKLSDDGIEAPPLSVNMAKELVFCGSQQVKNIIQMMVSYWMFENIMKFRPSESHGNWEILWNGIVSANKRMVSGLMVAIKEGNKFNIRLSGMENGFANFVDRIKYGEDARFALTFIEDEVNDFTDYAKEFNDKMSVSKLEAEQTLGSLLENTKGMHQFKSLVEQIEERQKSLDELVAEKHQMERDFHSAANGIGQKVAELGELIGRKKHADTMIAIANGEVRDAEAAARKFSSLVNEQMDQASKCIDKVKSTWEVPQYENVSVTHPRRKKFLGWTYGSSTTTTHEKKLIGYKTEQFVAIDTQESEAKKRLAEQSKAFGRDYAEKAKQAAKNKAGYEKESAQLEKEIRNLNEALETERKNHENTLKMKQKELDKLGKEKEKMQATLDDIKHNSGIVCVQQMIDFSNTMAEFKIAVIAADACADATQERLNQFVKNVKRTFQLGPANSSAKAITKPSFLDTEEVMQGMLEYFGVDEEEELVCEDEKEWDEIKNELVEELGLKKMNKMKLKKMGKWFLRSAAAEEEPSEISEATLKRLTAFAEPTLGFLSLFSTSSLESSNVLDLHHPEFQRAIKYGNAGALPAPEGPIIEEA